MARAQRRRGSRGRRAARERRQSRGSEEVTEGGAPAVEAVTTPRLQPQRGRSWNPFGFLKRFQPRAVAELADGEVLQAGRHAREWHGTDERGRPLASGLYLYRLIAGGQVRVGKLALIR